MPPEAQAAEAPAAAPPFDPTNQPGVAGRATRGGTVQEAANRISARMSPEQPETKPTAAEVSDAPPDSASDPAPATRKAKETPSPEPAQQPSGPEAEESELLRELDAAEETPGEGEKAKVADAPEKGPEAPTNMEDLAARLGVDTDALMDVLTLTVKADGVDDVVGLRDLVSGYQREADYRLKSAENADHRKELAQAAAATQAERQHYAQQIAPLLQQLGQAIQADEASMASLKEDDPYEYNRRRDALDETKKLLQHGQAEQQRMATLQEQQNQALMAEDVNQNAEALIDAVPEWGSSPETAKKDITEIKDYAVSEYGAPRDLVDNEYRSWALLMARDSMRYRKLVKSSEKRLKEVRIKPKYTKAGVGSDRPQTAVAQRVRKAQGRLHKSGRVRDFAAVLVSRGDL